MSSILNGSILFAFQSCPLGPAEPIPNSGRLSRALHVQTPEVEILKHRLIYRPRPILVPEILEIVVKGVVVQLNKNMID